MLYVEFIEFLSILRRISRITLCLSTPAFC
jgi:hypothetical protein